MSDGCEIGEQLDLIHKWVHKCAKALTPPELETANQLGNTIIDMLNQRDESNGIKILALLDALHTGAEHMEEHMPVPESDEPTTIQ